MKISQAGIDFIKWEEERGKPALKAYKDQVGVWTIGYGHAYVDKFLVITAEQAESLLRKDLERFESAINKLVKTQLNQNQYDALCSFTFNLGEGALGASRLLKHINNQHYALATQQFSRWVFGRVDGKSVKLAGLVARRKRESDLFSRPVI